jgi:hypothetical protein
MLQIPKEHGFWEGFSASPLRPSEKNKANTNRNVKQWWNDTDRKALKYWEKNLS